MENKTNLEQAFQKNYGILNPEQKAAVDAIEGPVMVVAGPGTGKTQILTLRIANIIKNTDVDPHNILALTFTEAAATNMRGRLAKFIGLAAHQVVITTFHGFANDIIQNHSESFPHIIGSQPVTEVEQIQILEQILVNNDFELLKPFGDNFYYIRAIRGAIDELKREGVDEGEFIAMVEKATKVFAVIPDLYYDSGAHSGKMKGKYRDEEKRINKNKELAFIYSEYQKSLRQENRYDFADMLVELLRVLRKDQDLKLSLQEQYQYILVDEHQDSNNAQNKILEQLMDFHDSPNLFVVGDEKQAVFRFQGASLENFYYFKHRYPSARMVTLKQNYRSTQTILSVADSLLAGEEALQSNTRAEEQLIQACEFTGVDQETFFVAMNIKEQLATGVEAEEIAVLYRNNRDVFALADLFDRLGIPYRIESDQDVLGHPVAIKFLTLLKGIVNYGEDKDLAKLLHLDLFNLDNLDIFKLIRSAGQIRKYQLYDFLRDPELRIELNLADDAKVAELFGNLEKWIKLSNNEHARVAANLIARSSGLLEMALGGDSGQENLLVIKKILSLIDELSSGVAGFTLKDFLGYLLTMESHNLSVKMKAGVREGRVRLMTAHRSKGLEFDYVYITRVHAGRFGIQKKRELLPLLPEVYQLFESGKAPEKATQDDERRLFYVALTRARKHVMVTYSLRDDNEREVLPSPFLQEIEQSHLEYVETNSIEEQYREKHGLMLETPKPYALMRIEDQEYVSSLFLKTGLSVSALNNYLKSPWQYFYRNLLRIPEPPNKHQAYGIAVHAALQELFEEIKNKGSVPSVDQVVRSFVTNLDQQVYLQGSEYEESKTRGETSLALWYEKNKDNWGVETLNEFRIPSVYLDETIRLTGVLDKVELLSDTEVNVVDYKTGKPRTRNDIMGNTANSTGDYYRQLVFYKLLLRYWQDGRYNMKSGEIVFVEPDASGKFRSEKFEISDDEVDALEVEIRRVAGEIQGLSFWNNNCDPEVCDYCDLVEVIQNKG